MLAETLARRNLVDVGECFEADRDVHYTHYQGHSHARLDRMYISLDLIQQSQDYDAQPICFPDHLLVKVCIGNKQRKSKFSWYLWKLNGNLLKNEWFMTFIAGKIQGFDQMVSSKIVKNGEIFKQEIKIKAIHRSGSMKCDETNNEKCLRATLEILIAQETNDPGVFTDDINNIKHKLEVLDEERYCGALIRTGAEHWALGEKPHEADRVEW